MLILARLPIAAYRGNPDPRTGPCEAVCDVVDSKKISSISTLKPKSDPNSCFQPLQAEWAGSALTFPSGPFRLRANTAPPDFAGRPTCMAVTGLCHSHPGFSFRLYRPEARPQPVHWGVNPMGPRQRPFDAAHTNSRIRPANIRAGIIPTGGSA